MYGKGAGCSVVSGCVLLPNTGGNTVLTIVAIAGITIGSASLVSTFARFVAKKAFTKA